MHKERRCKGESVEVFQLGSHADISNIFIEWELCLSKNLLAHCKHDHINRD